MKTFFVKILGCQQNDHDGARLKYLLENLGMVESDPKYTDLIMIVACSVRQTAVDRIYGFIKNNSLKPLNESTNLTKVQKRKTILVTGCVLESDKKKLAEKGVLFWDIEKPKELAKLLKVDSEIVDRQLQIGAKFSTSVPIMFGCNNFCTYCATAFTRGRERSRPMNEVINDAQVLISRDAKEILLLGQNVNSYKDPSRCVIPDLIRDPDNPVDSRLRHAERGLRGNDEKKDGDKEKKSDFVLLLKQLNDLDGNFLISFTSNHPKDMTNDIIEAVATLPKIKKQIHLPLQSGSDKILKAMKRPYTVEEYLRLVENCKLKIENLILTTDIIVGFPGEAEEDFQQTVDIVKKVKFDLAYVNKYSPRPGTVAYGMTDDVSQTEKRRRWKILNDLINK